MNNILRIVNLNKYFNGVKAVHNFNVEIEQGKITGLIGPNGSGKTTVFNLISGITKPDIGKIILDDTEITQLSIQSISKIGLSRVFQHSRLFHNLTVYENLALAINKNDGHFWLNLLKPNQQYNTRDRDQLINEILDTLGLNKVRNITTRELSYGQKRLVEIAKGVLQPHKIILLDEPIAGVNPFLKQTISDYLKLLRQRGETILLIEHDLSFILGLADEVIVMDTGKIIAKGVPDEILNNPLVIEAYLGQD